MKNKKNPEGDGDAVKRDFQSVLRLKPLRRRKKNGNRGDRVEDHVERHDFIEKTTGKSGHRLASRKTLDITETLSANPFPC